MGESGAQPSRSRWFDAALLTAIGSLFVSGATAVNGWYSVKKETIKQTKELQLEEFKKTKELELAQNGQFHEIRQKYLVQAIDPQRDLQYRLSVLNFLVDTFGDKDPMGKWAGKELQDIQAATVTKHFSKQEADEYASFLEWKKQQHIPHAKVRGHLSLPNTLDLGLRGGEGICCVPCQGLTICGKTVTTDCGSCSAK